MPPLQLAGDPMWPNGPDLTEAISAAVVESEDGLVTDGARAEVIEGRVAFQTDTEDEFTAAIPRLTRRRVVASMSANQTTPGAACELFFLDAAPLKDSIVASA
jgi:hypothetical protein